MVLALTGCAARKGNFGEAETSTAGAATGAKPSAVIVTPATVSRGRITSVNATARHVVVSYAIGIPLPLADQRLNVYRAGLKVAELKVSKERIDVNVIADITAGGCAVGDEARAE
jgi:hypothetical protein